MLEQETRKERQLKVESADMESVQSRRSTSVYLSREDEPLISPNKAPTDSPSKAPFKKTSPFWKLCRSWLFQKLKTLFIILFIATNVTLSIWIVFMHGNLPEMFNWDPSKAHKTKKCHFPEIHPYSADIKPLLKDTHRLLCDDVANPDFKRQVFFKTDREGNLIKVGEPGIPCCYRPVYRVNDGEVWIEPTRDHRYICHNITQRVTPIPPQHEVIEVVCDTLRQTYRDGFQFVPRKPEIDSRVQMTLESQFGLNLNPNKPISEQTDRLSVIVLGFDSTSQLNFIRRMPKSLGFLQNNLKAIKLRGYNKVGENTLPNLVPILSGMSLDELKDRCIEQYPTSEMAVHIDHCPWIWKNFSSSGYVTSFAEDEVETGVFNLHWPRAFLTPPTDHYYRTFGVRMWNTQNTYDGMCQGPRLSFQNLMDNVEKVAATYDTRKDLLFHFTWASKLSHDDFNKLAWGDDYLVKALEFLESSGRLNHTVLFLLGDHGSRNQEVRQTRQGQLEDRMPLAYIVPPPFLESKYPTAYKNLRKNADALTSAYDVHETLKDLMNMEPVESIYAQYMRQAGIKLGEKRAQRIGISLFTEIPENRGCSSAGIPPHWCICHKKFPVSVKALDVADAAGFIVRGLNNILAPYAQKCETLRLGKIKSALKWHPEETIQDSYQGNSQEETYKRSSLLQVAFETNPGNAQYEVTVLYEPDNGWRFTEQVVRLDSYEEHSQCIHPEEVRKLCYCKKPKTSLDNLEDFAF